MKRPFIFFLALFFALLVQAQEPTPSPVKLLTIGNSFAQNATAYLGDMARADKRELVLCGMNLAGHSLEQHASYIAAHEDNPADPRGNPYKNPFDPKGPKISLRQALGKEKWDFVTIQQASPKSYFPETYEPFAKTIVEYVRKYAPQAEILVLETWAYREDHAFFAAGDLNQASMYARLHAAYEDLAARYGLRIIPIGTAFQNARKDAHWKFIYPDPNFNYQKPKPGEVPKQTGSLNIGWRWGKDAETGELGFLLDAKHANTAGKFLGAATLYEMIFGANAEKNTFLPPGLPAEEATLLRKVAHDTVAGSPEAKKVDQYSR